MLQSENTDSSPSIGPLHTYTNLEYSRATHPHPPLSPEIAQLKCEKFSAEFSLTLSGWSGGRGLEQADGFTE